MKLTIPRRDLLAILTHAVQVVERRNTIPILANVALYAKDNTLTIKATDLDIEVENAVACEVAQPGSTTVPAKMLGDIVKKLKADTVVVLEQPKDNSQLSVKAGRSHFKLQTLPIEDFPDIDIKDVRHEFELPAAHLGYLLGHTHFCISTEETRYYLNGMFFERVGNGKSEPFKLRGVATDGHRLARIECDAPAGTDTFGAAGGVIVPRKTAERISAILDDGGIDKVSVRLNDVRVRFKLGNVIITSKLIDGTFPDYGRVIPEGNDKVIRADRKELLEAVDRLATIASERGRVAKFSLSTGKLTLSISSPDAGSATEDLDADYIGDPMDIGFNSAYMIAILTQAEGDQVEFRLADPGSPAIITGVGKPDALFVQMPMRA